MMTDEFDLITYIVKVENAQKLLMPMIDCDATIQLWDIVDLNADDFVYLTHTAENELFCEGVYKDDRFIVDTFGEPEHLYVFYDHPDKRTETLIKSIAFKCVDICDLY